jgi:succinate dehydrogenase/fumarate reductase-like Fe-S protein
MKYETLRRYYRPEDEAEVGALKIALERSGTYHECAECHRCVAGCDLISNDYEGMAAFAKAARLAESES